MTTILDVWISNREFLENKTVDQIISITADGILSDGSETSLQFRNLLSNTPSCILEKFAEECLTQAFKQGGFILQDIVNEIGRRLGFSVQDGFYKGIKNRIGFDGLWRTKDNHSFVIEVKTTDAYRINLDTFAEYRNKLMEANQISKDSSVLIVVGREDTGGLEAQTRGSKQAWDIRIISIEALIKLMHVKEKLSDDFTVNQIHQILKPLEYTRVDRLIDVIFNTSEDIQRDIDIETPNEHDIKDPNQNTVLRPKPVSYHDECVEKVSNFLHTPLIKRGKCLYTSADDDIRIVCLVSKEYVRGNLLRYWYAFHPSQKEFLASGRSSIVLGCGSSEVVLLIPFDVFQKHLSEMRTTTTDKRFYWHVEVFRQGEKLLLNYQLDGRGIEVTKYLLKVSQQ